jgi:hypothetical protein
LEEDPDNLKRHLKNEYERLLKLGFILEFKELINLMFEYGKKELALFMIENNSAEVNGKHEIFEICLENDEDIAM